MKVLKNTMKYVKRGDANEKETTRRQIPRMGSKRKASTRNAGSVQTIAH